MPNDKLTRTVSEKTPAIRERWEVREVDYLGLKDSLTFEISAPDRKYWVAHTLRKDDADRIAAVPDLLWSLKAILADLPSRRDWLDPDVEKIARAALTRAKGRNA